jgi:hypothetical protein
MKAIYTKVLPATNTKSRKVKAFDLDNNSITISYEDDGYKQAAIALCQKMNWHGTLTGGSVKDGYVFVFSDPTNAFEV